RCYRDWSSDVCSSDLGAFGIGNTALNLCASINNRFAVHNNRLSEAGEELIARLVLPGADGIDQQHTYFGTFGHFKRSGPGRRCKIGRASCRAKAAMTG